MKGSRTKYSSGFDPKTIPGCSLWLDAADASTLTLSGSSVTAWADKSGNGYTATGVVAPTYDATTRYLLFNGSSQYFTLPNGAFPTGNTPYSIFLVAYTNNAANPQWILAGGTESTNQAIGVIFYFTNAIWHSWWGNEYRVENSISNGVPAILALSYSTTRTTIVNGGTATTNTPGASRNTSSGPNFIGRRVSSVEYLNGGLGEILIFSSELPTAQRQQIEGYLVRKWGLTQVNLLSAPHPYQTLAPVGFLPTSIPGCSLWLDAADSTTFTLSGSNVTQWRDKTQGFAGTGVGNPVYTTVDGYSAVTFNGTQYIDFGDVADLGTAPLNIFAVSKFNAGGSGGIIAKSFLGIGQNRWALFREGSTLLTFALGDTGQGVLSYSDTNSSRRVLSWTWDRSTQTLYQNGVSIASGGYANTSSISTTHKLLVGAYNNGSGGTPPADGYYLNGSINEIVCIFGTMSTLQRQQVEGYLAWKWGTRTTSIALPATHPYATFPPTLRPFGPTDVSGCILWLDAADRKTLFQDSGGTQPITAVGQSIGLWKDKSTRGYSMTVPSGKSAPTYGPNVITTTGTNALWSTTNFELTGNAKLTLFFVFASSVASGYNSSCTAWIGNPNGAVAGKIIGLGIAVQGLPDNYQYYVPSTFSSAELSSTQPRLVGVTTLTMAKYDGASVFGNYNGTPLAPSGIATSGGANWAALPFQTGMRSANAGGSADGFMCEVLCYNDALSTLQIQQIEGYLARKWGLNSSVAVGHPYRFGLPPLTAGFTPQALTGCAVWFDAADRTSLTLSGSNVTQWRDKSGNGRHLNSTGGPPTYAASSRSIVYNGSQWLSSADYQIINPTTGTWSVFLVATVDTASAVTQLFFDADGPPYRVGQFLRAAVPGGEVSSIGFDSGGNLFTANAPGTISLNTPFLGGAVNDISILTAYLNGAGGSPTSHSTNNTYPANVFSAGVNIEGGGRYSYLFGRLSEIVFYSRAVSTVERQQIEGYLAWKWGLQGSLPGGHPFRMLKP